MTNKKMTMLQALSLGEDRNKTRLTYAEIMGCGLYSGLIYGDIGERLQFSYRPDAEGVDQYLMHFAREIENRVRTKIGVNEKGIAA
ncbi:MAG: hypothetical protein ABJA84_00195 [Polaromonas sp.]